MNLVNSSDSFRNTETWTPICLPKFNDGVAVAMFTVACIITRYVLLLLRYVCITTTTICYHRLFERINSRVASIFSHSVHTFFMANTELLLIFDG